jgi:DHA3 family macrolide efflux protein-like MFS transporter
MTKTPSPGMRTFFLIWAGQLVSLIGSQLTGFALGVWVYDETGSVLMLALAQIAMQAPFVILSPLAGVLVDRWDRRTAMIVSDLGAGSAVLAAAVLYLTGVLRPWMVIPVNFVMAAFHSLMWPAYTAVVSLLVPKEQYGRANGFVQLGEAVPQIAGPAIAGALYVAVKLGYLALIDFVTYVFAVSVMLILVRIPAPPATVEGHRARGSIIKEMTFGWDYIVSRRGLLSLLMYFLVMNFLSAVLEPLFVPLVLDTWDARVLGYLSTIMGVGMLAGTLVMSAWGGGRRKVITLLAAGGVGSLFLAAAGARAYIPLLAIAGFGFMFTVPLMNASSQTIWQSKVAPDVQGRVFAIRRAIAWSTLIAAPLLAAPLADHVFKPAMAAGGALEPLLGPVIGSGAGRGIGLLIMVLGILSAVVSFLAFGSKTLRNVEADLPDYSAGPKPPVTASTGETAG